MLRLCPHALVWVLCLSGMKGVVVDAWAQARTQVSLLLDSEAARPGETVWTGVRLTPPPGWHTYWRNPGESGKATEVRWHLPPGVSAGPVQWPVPEPHVAGGLTTYVYKGEVVLLVPLTLDHKLSPGVLKLEAEIEWLECEVACVPGHARVHARLEVAAQQRYSLNRETLSAWMLRLPKRDTALKVEARWTTERVGEKVLLEITGPISDSFNPNDFYGYETDGFDVLPSVLPRRTDPGKFAIGKWVNTWGSPLPAKLSGLLVQRDVENKPLRAVEVTLSVDTAVPALAAGEASSTPAETKLLEDAQNYPFWLLLSFAFLGGMILNIMPCVLPVIALKVLGFIQESDADAGRVRFLGLVYVFGVLFSFLVLAGLVIAVKAAGGSATWGLQLQNPVFRLVLLSVVVLVALNLFGVFEVFLPRIASQATGKLASQHGVTGAFFHGVLATLLATPCTAPFLAVALGFAFAQPPLVLLLFFTTVALGLAFPYALLCWYPKWLKFLPKPGLWMLRFKTFLGFPMLATAVWLLDINATGFGEGSVLWLGLFLLVLCLAAWVWGEFGQQAGKHRGVAAWVCLVIVGTGYWGILERQLDWRKARTPTANQKDGVLSDYAAETLQWLPWSHDAVQAARTSGHPVLVDFTAKWCLTCQLNKKVALEAAEVRNLLVAKKYRVFRADYTNPNPSITAELQRYNRAGVPLVLVFPSATNHPPFVLPEILTPSIVLEALEKAAAKG